ncbi:MAG: hypothetical protein AAB070_02270 [Candidatus Binatota bacterium]|jgi:hypothetical protein
MRFGIQALNVKPRDIYSSYLLVGGFLCLVLGLGNWIVGAIEITRYQGLLHKTAQTGLEDSYRSFQELDHQKNEEVLRPINEDREKYNAARIKLDFYYVVVSGGRLLFLIGALLTFFALIRVIRQDTMTKMRRLAASTLRNQHYIRE